MKPIQVVFNSTLLCNFFVAPLLSSLLTIATTVRAVSDSHRFVDQTESRVLGELEHSSLRVLAPHTLTDEEKVFFVAEMIKQELPKHPESDKIARIIVTESRNADIDPLFVAAVVRAESMFRHKAESHRGAKGLMQLMPQTGQYVAKLSKIQLKQTSDLHNPETNIKLGVWYLKYLEKRFKGCREKLLVAYNWGPSNLNRALSNRTAYPRESIQYVQKVLAHHTLWSYQLVQHTASRRLTAIG
jgi:hypothetical protein